MFKILVGDFSPHMATLHSNNVLVGICNNKPEKIDLNGRIVDINILTTEQKKSMLKTVATGSLGMIVFGPVGLLAGLLGGGNSTEMVVEISLVDKRRIIALISSDVYQNLVIAQNNIIK